MKNTIIWFRNDLRLHDQEALYKGSEGAHILPVYIFDLRQFKDLDLGFKKSGVIRTEFLRQSVSDLKRNLRSIGADLLVKVGYPEEILPELVRQHHIQAIFSNKEGTWEEIQVEKKLRKNLNRQNVDLQLYYNQTLIHPEDLPFSVDQIPDVFSNFRKKIEKHSNVRDPLPTPSLKMIDTDYDHSFPTLEDLGFKEETPELRYPGGERHGLARLNHYFWESDQLKNYKFTRNGLLGEDYSSKFSPWLALGALSPRYIYQQVKEYEKERKKNISTYWLVFELLWRDYFRYVAAKYGNKLFFITGIKGINLELNDDEKLFQKWTAGETGIPFIDANMRELNKTGFMSNRGRQNVASFLVKDLKVNWTWGAAYFESKLIDYDVCSNWGNWNYVAGVGNDPRENRYFNIIRQAQKYDAKGNYVKSWLPELSELESAWVHFPGLMGNDQLMKSGVRLDDNYPKNIIRFEKWLS